MAINGIRCRLRERGAQERPGNHVTWIVDAGVDTRIRYERSQPPQWHSRGRKHSGNTGSEGKSGR